jgi:catalase
VADAYAHLKFIGHVAAAKPLLQKASVLDQQDEGFISLQSKGDVRAFVAACRSLRYWQRESRAKEA